MRLSRRSSRRSSGRGGLDVRGDLLGRRTLFVLDGQAAGPIGRASRRRQLDCSAQRRGRADPTTSSALLETENQTGAGHRHRGPGNAQVACRARVPAQPLVEFQPRHRLSLSLVGMPPDAIVIGRQQLLPAPFSTTGLGPGLDYLTPSFCRRRARSCRTPIAMFRSAKRESLLYGAHLQSRAALSGHVGCSRRRCLLSNQSPPKSPSR